MLLFPETDYNRNKSINFIIMTLKEISKYLDSYITRQEKLDVQERDVNYNSLYDALEIIDSVVYFEPTDDEMMSMFGTKWHDGL